MSTDLIKTNKIGRVDVVNIIDPLESDSDSDNDIIPEKVIYMDLYYKKPKIVIDIKCPSHLVAIKLKRQIAGNRF